MDTDRQRLGRVLALVAMLSDPELAALEQILLREQPDLAEQPGYPQVRAAAQLLIEARDAGMELDRSRLQSESDLTATTQDIASLPAEESDLFDTLADVQARGARLTSQRGIDRGVLADLVAAAAANPDSRHAQRVASLIEQAELTLGEED
jgi:hypothetical protein